MSESVDLDGIEARANAATPGPWRVVYDNEIHTSGQREVVSADLDDEDGDYPTAHVHIRDADAEFIAHARADVPALVAEVRALRAKVEAVEAVATLFDERDNGALSYAAWKVRGALHSGERVS